MNGKETIATIRTGTTLGHYRVDDLIGQGGRGTVYLAYDLKLHRKVALKTIRPEFSESSDAVARFKREARAAAALNHPRIATLFDFDESDETLFLVYELLKGMTLRQYAHENRLTIGDVINFGVQIGEGLLAAHESGIVHRDIKPENIMVLEDKRIKILDFGLVKIGQIVPGAEATGVPSFDGHLTTEGMILGTLHYMSPEQLEGREVDHLSDLFSYGVLLYELSTGRLPFTASSSAGVISKIIECAPKLPRTHNPNVPETLETLIVKMIRRDPAQRYQTVKAPVAQLKELKRQMSDEDTLLERPAEPEYFLNRTVARILLFALQLLYIGMYFAALRYNQEMQAGFTFILGEWLADPIINYITVGVLLIALVGFAVRLYLISMIGFDHVLTGVRFRKAFPLFFVLDLLWALTPLALIQRYDLWWALPCIPPLVFLPFSQRTLIRSAYDTKTGRRISTDSRSRPQ
ncbi:serine/threonine protein kinase [Acidobacteriota bacterium]